MCYRRERNKLLARKSRLKMKTEMDELKEKFILLMKENESLRKDLVTTAIPGIAAEALIGNNISPPASIMCLVHQLTARTARGWVDPSRLSSVAFCISNALSADIPLVYVSPGFSHLTGYGLHEVLGRNCRFLQGPGTNRDEVTHSSWCAVYI